MKLKYSSLLSKRESIKKLIKKTAVKGRIPCSTLRRIAEKNNIPYNEAGKIADGLKIKIKNCDLGCF